MEGSTVSQGKIFPGRVDLLPIYRKQDKDKGESIRAAIEGAREYERDHDTIWIDGSKLDSGGVGVGIAWYEKVKEEGLQGLVQIDRKGELGKGVRRGKGKLGRYTYAYLDGQRSFREAWLGWRTAGFGMGGGPEAFDAELAAIAYGLIHLLGYQHTGRTYTIFTDSTAAMTRITSDAPGPGQEMAVH